MKTRRKIVRLAILFLIVGLLKASFGLAGESRVKELARLSIEELISIKVTSVLKTPQSWSESPAAVYVVTQEDIRRSGAANIPDILRIVPGVHVAELDEKIFAVSIRGFNDIHANKLLVMVDGRSIYNHIFSGVIWSHIDVFMEDIERIEVIRGPGSSVWGANAVNGVINIITKNAEDTKGTFIEFSGGKPDTLSGGVRYGGELGDDAFFRIYVRGNESSNDHISQTGFDARSELDSVMGGFRADWNIRKSDVINLQGEMIDSGIADKEDNPLHPERKIDHRAWNLLSRWRHTFSQRSETTWQIYYQHEERVDGYQFDTIDLDFQHDYEWSARHQLAWGLGYRFVFDEIAESGLLGNYSFDPVESNQSTFSFFIQDMFQLAPDSLALTAGSKFEHNDYTGAEIQPGIRISWTPHERHYLWGAVSRAVRMPSRLNSDSVSHGPLNRPTHEPPEPGGPGTLQTQGNRDFDSEELIAYEVGYRTQPLENLRLDLALFYNAYDHLATYEERKPGIWVITNDMAGETYGFEVSVDFHPTAWWRLSGSWSFSEMDMRLKNERAADLGAYLEDTNPRHQFSLHSAMTLGRYTEFDVWLRHTDGIANMRPRPLDAIPDRNGGYTAFDARLAWKPTENIELSVIGRNLGQAHQEFTQYEVEQSICFKVKFQTGNGW